jgi:hypothetical protein
MILESIVTTWNADRHVNVAPMGPRVDATLRQVTLRPFQTSTTFRNLQQLGQGVLHVTDDVLLFARAAVGLLDPMPELVPATLVQGMILRDACRALEFRVTNIDASQARAQITVEIVCEHRLRDFIGFNRAKHAVIEAAILATRLHLLPREDVDGELRRLQIIVEKTAGDQELAAFAFLVDYVASVQAAIPKGER